MNMWITAEPTTSPSAAHAIRQRLMGKPKPIAALQIVDKTVRPTDEDTDGLKNRVGNKSKKRPRPRPDADHHVRVWRLRNLSLDNPSLLVTDFLKLRCIQMDVCYRRIMTESRTKDLILPRHQLMAEVHARYPHFSKPHIGRIFGRDHTVVIYAIRKMAEITGDGDRYPG